MKRPVPCAARGVVALLFTLCPLVSFAHDLWILPGKYRLRSDEVTRVFINNGDEFPESLTLLGAPRVSDLRVVSVAGASPISDLRVDGKSLTFDFRPTAAGPQVIVLSTRPRTVRMRAEDFEDYLAEEGLETVKQMRKEREETDEPAVERYTKFAKTVLDVGDEADSNPLWAENTGLPFEIVPLEHPNRLAPGGVLRLRVVRNGEPIAGVSIVGARASGSAREISATTDARGEAQVTVSAPGRWYVRALYVARAEGDPEVAWESLWATLSFEVQSQEGSGR
jgi:uncharacterized GH25 family protein